MKKMPILALLFVLAIGGCGPRVDIRGTENATRWYMVHDE